MSFTRYYGKFSTLSLQRRPSAYTLSKALATSHKTAPVNLLSSENLPTLSSRHASCLFFLCLSFKPNSTWQYSSRSFASRWTSVSSFVAKSFLTVLINLMGIWDRVKSFPGFIMDTTREGFSAGGKYCLRMISVRNVKACSSRCLRTLSKHLSRPEPCQTWDPSRFTGLPKVLVYTILFTFFAIFTSVHI